MLLYTIYCFLHAMKNSDHSNEKNVSLKAEMHKDHTEIRTENTKQAMRKQHLKLVHHFVTKPAAWNSAASLK